MSEKDDNKKEIKSKIEQIRIDLEKKLAAIEKTKIDSKKSDAKLEVVSSGNSESNSQVDSDSDPVFEISEPIESVEESKKVVIPVKSNESTVKVSGNEKTESNLKKVVVVANNEVSAPPKTIVESINKGESNNDLETETIEFEEEKSKKGIFNYLIYGFLIALFLVIGYLVVDYMKENKNLQNDKMNQKLSEFKNKRYLDSIELADLNNQLLDMQSKKMIDSLDRIYENELIASSKFADKKTIKRNYKFLNDRKNTQPIQNTSVTKPVVASIVNDGDEAANSEYLNESIVNSKDINNENSSEVTNASTNVASDSNNNVASSNEDKTINEETAAKNKELASVKPKIVKVPVYPGCEKKKSEFNRKKCLTAKMYRHINRKFNSDMAQNSGLSDGLHQVKVSFIIDKRGYATVLHVRGENKKLEQEAIRVIQTLPKMKPGTIDGSASKMQYVIPIKFVINN